MKLYLCKTYPALILGDDRKHHGNIIEWRSLCGSLNIDYGLNLKRDVLL